MCIRDSTQTIVLIKKNREKMMMTVVLRRFAKEFDTHHGLFRRFSQAMSNDRSSVCNTCKAVNSPTILSCIKCKMLQSPPDTLHKVNFFTLFGISPAFELDVKDLERKYHSLQKSYHPDKVDPRSEDVIHKYSSTLSSIINDAYKTLKNDLSRAHYLLKMEGMNVFEEGNRTEDVEFLEEILTIQEEIEETQDPEIVEKHKQENHTRKHIALHKITELFREGNSKEIGKFLVKLKYYGTIDDTISRWEDRHPANHQYFGINFQRVFCVCEKKRQHISSTC
eukprot:TRINITY_DN5172_c0_g1_i2.p1 TRINITY_DN5172_c0_g1~~TRINITY_DN5172_c0_g1_i2.p1  ORF type:complete len:300 (+),score=72.57 TRINITY_DN5172_c0_g1_i2:61-900(+)